MLAGGQYAWKRSISVHILISCAIFWNNASISIFVSCSAQFKYSLFIFSHQKWTEYIQCDACALQQRRLHCCSGWCTALPVSLWWTRWIHLALCLLSQVDSACVNLTKAEPCGFVRRHRRRHLLDRFNIGYTDKRLCASLLTPTHSRRIRQSNFRDSNTTQSFTSIQYCYK